MRQAVRILGVVVVAIVVLIVVGLVAGNAKLRTTYAVAPEQLALSVPIASGNVERGRHIVEAITGCTECHAAGLKGSAFLDVPPFRIVAPNLTRGNGGIGASFSDADFVRAIRYGVAPDGHGLLVMPSKDFTHLSDRDLADVIAYIKSLPPVDNVLPPTQLRPLGLLMLAVGQLPLPDASVIDQSAPRPSDVHAAVDVQYGHYLASVAGCMGCHGAGLSGGAIAGLPPGSPTAQNITPAGIGTWSQADFMRALRIGRRPDGTTLNTLMPWSDYTRMTDAEISALWLYLRSVPPRATGTH